MAANSDMIPEELQPGYCPPGEPATPEEAYMLLAQTAQTIISQIAAGFTPLISRGLSMAATAQVKAESLMTRMATSDPRLLPQQIQEIQSLMSLIESDTYALSDAATGAQTSLPGALQNLPKAQGGDDSLNVTLPLYTLNSPSLSSVSGGLAQPTTVTSNTIASPPVLTLQAQPSPSASSSRQGQKEEYKCNDCAQLMVVLAAWRQELDTKITRLEDKLDATKKTGQTSVTNFVREFFGNKAENLGSVSVSNQSNGTGGGDYGPGETITRPPKVPAVGKQIASPPLSSNEVSKGVKSKSLQQATVGSLSAPDWSRPDVCAYSEYWGKTGTDEYTQEAAQKLLALSSGKSIGDILKAIANDSDTPRWLKSVLGTITGVSGQFTDAFVAVAQSFLNVVMAEIGCSSDSFAIPALTELIINFAAKYLGDELTEYSLPFTYWRRYECPQALPSAADANAAWLSGTINDQTWECWTRANGQRVLPAELVRDAARSKLTPDDYMALLLREVIDESQYESAMRQLGYTDKSDIDGAKVLSEAIPGVSDIIRFLVRDVADPRIVKTFDLDANFADKWQGELTKYAKAQGVSDELAKYEWRAHWDIPSPTQLYTMLQRLRPDNPNISPNIRVSADNVRLALQQDDIAPFWVDRLMAISYRPITRQDAKSAYTNSALSRPNLVHALQDYGYNAANAETLASIYDTVKVRSLLRTPEVRSYIDGFLSQEEITKILKDDGVENEIISKVIIKADTASKVKLRKDCGGQVIKAFRKGELSETKLISELHTLGLSASHVTKLVSAAKCQRRFGEKEATASQLCQFLRDGLINATEMQTRLLRLGYSVDSAKLIAADCAKRVEIQHEKEETKHEREVERKREKELKAEEKKAKEIDGMSKKQRKKKETLPPLNPQGGESQP